MQNQRITDRQKKILYHLSNNYMQGSIETKMIGNDVVKVTDSTGGTEYFSMDENDAINRSDKLDMETLNSDMSEYVFFHTDTVDVPQAQHDRQTLVVSAFGGPGSGKTVACMDICQQLKKRGYNAEYVSEVAKDYVYDENYEMLDGSAEHQYDMLQEQLKRVDRYMGKVDFVVTDSPVLLNGIYNRQLTPEYEHQILQLHEQYNNFVFFVNRDESHFQMEGRIHDLEESMEKDEQIRALLDKNKIYYGTYEHKTVDKIVDNSIHTLNRIRNQHENKLIQEFISKYYLDNSIGVEKVNDREYRLSDITKDSITVRIQADRVVCPEAYGTEMEFLEMTGKSSVLHPDLIEKMGLLEDKYCFFKHVRLTAKTAEGKYVPVDGMSNASLDAIQKSYERCMELKDDYDIWELLHRTVSVTTPGLEGCKWEHYGDGSGGLYDAEGNEMTQYDLHTEEIRFGREWEQYHGYVADFGIDMVIKESEAYALDQLRNEQMEQELLNEEKSMEDWSMSVEEQELLEQLAEENLVAEEMPQSMGLVR